MSRSRISGSYDRYIFNFLRDCETVFQSLLFFILICSIWAFQLFRVIAWSIFFNCSHSHKCVVVSHCGLIFISLMTLNILCAYLHLSFLVKYKNVLSIKMFSYWVLRALCLCWIYILYHTCHLQKFFSSLWIVFFIFLMYFKEQKFLILMFILSSFVLWIMLLFCYFRSLPNSWSLRFSTMFSSRWFIILPFTFAVTCAFLK